MLNHAASEDFLSLPRISRQLWRAWWTIDADGEVIDPALRDEVLPSGPVSTWWGPSGRRSGQDRRSHPRENHLTTHSIAAKIDKTQPYVSNLFSGKSANPTYVVIEQLARVFHVTPGYLFTDDDPDVVRRFPSEVQTAATTPGQGPSAVSAALRRSGYSDAAIALILKLPRIRSVEGLAGLESVLAVLLAAEAGGG